MECDNMKRSPIKLMAVSVTAGLLALTACGSDDSDADDPVTEASEAVDEAVDEAQTEVTEAMTEASEAVTEASDAMSESSDAMAEDSGTIVDVAVAAGSFGTLVAAVQAAELVDALSAEGPLTVFAPTDEAFAALPAGLVDCLLLPENKEALTSILTYHVVEGAVTSGDLSDGDVPTLQGENVTVDLTDGVMINDAVVVQADVTASNGVIHAVDAVLVPPSIDVEAFLASCPA
jgi:uncharacterized surface protein with fasciclin (FAS1) repeats